MAGFKVICRGQLIGRELRLIRGAIVLPVVVALARARHSHRVIQGLDQPGHLGPARRVRARGSPVGSYRAIPENEAADHDVALCSTNPRALILANWASAGWSKS